METDSAMLHAKLKEFFGFDSFKADQERIIKHLTSGNNAFVLMPTGGGKSMCYQLPALVMEGTAIVISPLIALMKNQVDAIRGFVSGNDGIAHFLNSSLNKAQITEVRNDLMSGATKLLYVAPESLTKAENVAMLKEIKISFYAVDEAHCISEWGHDFRPEYRRIRNIIEEISVAPIIALTATAIFQFENLAFSETCTIDGVKAILAGTFMAEGDWAQWFMDAGRETGVSPYHLASRARQEQGVSGNPLAHGTAGAPYNGYYNIFNVNAYATDTLSPIQNGARYAATTNAAYHLPWTTPLLAIRGGAVILGNSYINREQNTLYLQKFDVTDGGNGYYRHQYMTNIFAPASEAVTLANAYSDEVKAGAMEFCIPVYEDMPEKVCEKPTSTGSNDNWLSALTVTDRTFTPAFDTYRLQYEMSVPAAVSSLRVNATAYSATATVGGVGTVVLKSGMNTVDVKVTAASGAVRIYTLSVYRTPSETGGDENAPTLESEIYRIEDTVQGIAPGTTAEDFLKNFTLSDTQASLIVVNGEGIRVTDTVGTGGVLHVFKGDTLYAVYPLLIRGDVNGDGAVSIVDLLQIQQHLLKVRVLSDHALHAADVSKDGAVTIVDLLKTQQHLLKVIVIEQ